MTGAPALGVALLRIVLGVIFVVHGYSALTVLTPTTAASAITSMGYPPALAPYLAWYLVAVQTLGGALMIVGLWTGLVALLQVPILASVLFLVHLPQGFVMRGIIVDAATGQAVAGGYEYPLLVLAATLAQALLGAGAVSVDERRSRPRPRRVP